MVLTAKEKSYFCIVPSIVVGQICYEWNNNNTTSFRGFVPAYNYLENMLVRRTWLPSFWRQYHIYMSCSTYSIAERKRMYKMTDALYMAVDPYPNGGVCN